MPRILVVEDDADLQFLYEQTLSRGGHEVTAARNTTDAIVHLTTGEFDLVILDMNMPDMPGLKVLEFAQGDVRLSKVPIVVVSAIDQNRERAQELGANYFLIKPVPFPQLASIIKKALGE